MRPTTNPLRLPASIVLIVVGITMLLAAPAGAEAETRVDDFGWWWRLQTGVGTALPPPGNVGEDQLLVQSSPEGAQAIAAISAVLAEGQTDPVVTLDVVDDNGGAQAVLLACQAGAAWTGVQAGRWDSKPTADCTTSTVGVRSEDGSQWSFDASDLQFDDRLSIVLVPGTVGDSGVPSSFSLVFDTPSGASIATTGGAAPPATTAPATTGPPVTQAAPVPTTRAPSSAPAAPPVTFAPVSPAVDVAPALDVADQGLTATAPIVNAATPPLGPAPVAADAGSRAAARLVGLLVLAAGMGGLVAVWRSRSFGGAAATPGTPVVGGLARFRTERTSEPTSVS